MIKNDFKDNIVEEFLLTLEEIKRNDPGNDTTLSLITESCKKYLGFNYTLLSSLAFDDLVKMLNNNRITDYTKITLLGILIKEEAVFLEKNNNTDFLKKYIKSFSILSKIAIEKYETKFKDFQEDLSSIIDKLLQYQLPTDTSKEIFKTLEELGKFSKAEDLAYEILEDDTDFKENLKEFYERILNLEDDIIIKGNLTRDEILVSISELN